MLQSEIKYKYTEKSFLLVKLFDFRHDDDTLYSR